MNREVVLPIFTRMFGGKCSVCQTQPSSILLTTIRVCLLYFCSFLLCWVKQEYFKSDLTQLCPDCEILFVLFLLILHCILRADLHHSWRGEAAQPSSDEAKGRVHRLDGRPWSPLSQEDWWEPACQHGVRTARPSWEDEGLGVTSLGMISTLSDTSNRASHCGICQIYETSLKIRTKMLYKKDLTNVWRHLIN